MQHTVAQDTVVGIHFTMKNREGEELDSTQGSQPLHYLHGHHNIVPGLEDALTGAAVGSTHQVVVEPAQAYGERSGAGQAVPRDQFPPENEIKPGMQMMTRTPDGEVIPLWVESVNDEEVKITFDHPFAGMELLYDVKVVDIRDATEKRDHERRRRLRLLLTRELSAHITTET